eukprot:jgi/Ulvmu1/4690/UM002_0421.1
MDIMAGAAMGSSLLRSRLVAVLVAPVSVCCRSSRSNADAVPLIVIIVQSLQGKDTAAQAIQPDSTLTTTTLSLLLNATHDCPAIGRECGPTVLRHMAKMLLSHVADIHDPKSEVHEHHTDACTLACGVLCFLINVLEQCPSSAVTLADMKLGSLLYDQISNQAGQLTKKTSDRDDKLAIMTVKENMLGHEHSVVNADSRSNAGTQQGTLWCTCGRAELFFMGSAHANASRSPQRSPCTKQRVVGSRRAHSGGPQRVGKRVGAPRQRTSASAGVCKQDRTEAVQPVSPRATGGRDKRSGEQILMDASEWPETDEIIRTIGGMHVTLVEHLCDCVINGTLSNGHCKNAYDSKGAYFYNKDGGSGPGVQNVRELAGLLVGYMLMQAQTERSPKRRMSSLCVSEVQCIVHETLSKQEEADLAPQTLQLLQWASGKCYR